MLAPLTPAELLFERLQEPSTESPILYRERAYLVDSLQTDDDLEEHLEAELSRIRRDWRHRDASQFVLLSLFDHRFVGEPSFPPIATLSWKDWQGRTEIWVRGVRRSTLPPGMSLRPGADAALAVPELPRPPAVPSAADADPPHSFEQVVRAGASARGVSSRPAPPSHDDSWLEPDAMLDPEENDDAEELELVELAADEGEPSSLDMAGAPPASAERSPSTKDAAAVLEPDAAVANDADAAQERAPDSGPAWQSPDRSGEYLIPLSEGSSPPPSSQRVPAGDELMDALFERMHELSSVLTIAAATDYVLGMLGEHIACDGVIVSGLDPATDELVVMRASGPRGRELIGRRWPLDVPPRGPALRQGETLELRPADLARSPGPWRLLDAVPMHAVVAPVLRQERLLGAIELCRNGEKGPFSAGQADALELVCQQLAEFIGDRSLDLARDSLLPEPHAE
jgi:GAF domain-containing protein